MELTLLFLRSIYRRLLFGPKIILMLSNPNTSRFPLKKTNSKNYTFTCLMEKDTKRPSKNYVIKDVLALISTQHSRSALPLKWLNLKMVTSKPSTTLKLRNVRRYSWSLTKLVTILPSMTTANTILESTISELTLAFLRPRLRWMVVWAGMWSTLARLGGVVTENYGIFRHVHGYLDSTLIIIIRSTN